MPDEVYYRIEAAAESYGLSIAMMIRAYLCSVFSEGASAHPSDENVGQNVWAQLGPTPNWGVFEKKYPSVKGNHIGGSDWAQLGPTKNLQEYLNEDLDL